MEKEEFLLSKKITFLFLIISLFTLQFTFSQTCPSPTGWKALVGICESEFPKVSDLDAEGENIEWFTTLTGGTALDPNDLLVSGDYFVQQSGTCGLPSPRVKTEVVIYQLPAPVINTTTEICFTIAPTIADLSSDPTILWYTLDYDGTEDLGIPLSPTTLLVNGSTYWASTYDASNCEGLNRTPTTVTLELAPNAGTDGSYSNCEIDLADTDLFTLLGGSPDATGTWTAPDGSAHSGTFVAGTDVAGVYTYTVAGGTICPDDTAIVTVAITVIPAPVITDADQSYCITALTPLPTLEDLVVDTIGAGNTVRWYADETSTVELPSTTILTNNTTYWASQFDTASNCESATRDSKTALIEIAPNAGTDGSYSDCEIDLADTDLFTLLGGSPDATGTWTAPDGSAHSGNFVAGTDVAGVYTYSVGGPICTPDTATVTVNITVVPAPTITANSPSFCIVDSKTVGDLVVDDATATITWYDAATGGNEILTTTVLTTTSLWASQTDTAGCESLNRTVVNVTIIDLQTPTTAPSQSFCLVNGPTVANLVATGTNVLWFENELDDVSLALDPALPLVDNKTYWAADVDSTVGCESPSRVSMIVTINDVTAPTTSLASQTYCTSNNLTIADLDINETNIVWYDSDISTTALSSDSLLENGKTYFAAQTDAGTGCESSVRLSIAVELVIPFDSITFETENIVCAIDNPTIANLTINDVIDESNGEGVLWYDEPNGNLLSLTDPLVDGNTYYYILFNADNCTSLVPEGIQVRFECDPSLYSTKTFDGFSPDNDGINETFKIQDIREIFPDFTIEIFNRWGNSVFKGNRNTNDWNGELNGNGKQVPAGVYYYIVNYNKGAKKPKQGRLYLSR